MRTCQTIASLALAAVATSCGELAGDAYQPPPVATIRGVLTLPAVAPPVIPGDAVRILLVWQLPTWTPDLDDVWWQGDPLLGTTDAASGHAALSCDRPDDSCAWSGTRTCTVRHGRSEAVATVPYPGPSGSVEFEAPIFAVPPPEARYGLAARGSNGTLAVGYLVFLRVAPGGGTDAESVLASSAFNRSPAPGVYRTSYYVTYLEGDPGGSLPATPVGPLDSLELGFGLVLKFEREDGSGRLLPVGLMQLPADSPIAVNGHGAGEGGEWCDPITIDQTWDSPGFFRVSNRCKATTAEVACDSVSPASPGPCRLAVTRYQFDASCRVAPPGCAPDTFITEVPATEGEPPSVLQAHVAFQRLPGGSVLAIGGTEPDDPLSLQTALYDSTGREWWMMQPPSFPRAGATVTSLPSGKVLVTGGSTRDDDSRSAELFDPTTGAWTRTGSMWTARTGHTATLLPSGGVLVVGGSSVASPGGTRSAERYDPARGTWEPYCMGTEVPPLLRHAAILLPGDGDELLITGSNGGPEAYLCDSACQCRATGTMHVAHRDGTFTLLPTGKVLALGGRSDPTGAEVFDPATELWTDVAAMPHGRASHAAVLLPSGEVLVAGGELDDGGTRSYPASADRYDPVADRWTPTLGPMEHPRSGLSMIAMEESEVLVLGGHDATGDPLPVERYCP